MTEQPPAFTENAALSQQQPASQKLESLLTALNRLKSEISGVEARHPGFGSELSALCETVITELNSRDSRREDVPQVDRNSPCIITVEPADMPDLAPTAKRKSNSVVSAIDKAGSCLITGLDKTGDGIIFILGKLFTNRLPKAGPGVTAEADL